VGKSLIAAGLGRLLSQLGVRVAPFKAQNMSLNSYVTPEGGEMGRAQVLQAQACGVVPHVNMNPILLKPEAETCSQVVVQGRVWGKLNAKEYFERKPEMFRVVKDSFARLAARHEVIVIEGAGSAAEVNLRDRDLVNWPVVEMADAAVIIVADIDRGGVFAQIIGTLDLLEPQERRRVLGVIVNKFRGDRELFDEGVRILETRAKVPVLGVVPYLGQLELDQEDSLSVASWESRPFSPSSVNIGVILLPHMSNFTDFNVLAAEGDVAIRYIKTPEELDEADVIILPGTKNTIADFRYLAKVGFGQSLGAHVQKNRKELLGICGGFQMLGREVTDPHHVEEGGMMQGLNFLDMTSELSPYKHTSQIQARPLFLSEATDCRVLGYEIHMGFTKRFSGSPCFSISDMLDNSEEVFRTDGVVSSDGLVWGTYLHGLFDEPEFRRTWLNRIRKRKGLSGLDVSVSDAVSKRLSGALDRWARHVERYVHLQPILSYLNLKCRVDP